MSPTQREDLYLFTDCDIDGAGCYYILRKVVGANFGHKQTTEKKFRDDFLQLTDKDKYKKIYICDLSVLENNLDIIDLPNVVFINHRGTPAHPSHKNLRFESQDLSSCTLLLYKKLKDKLKVQLTKEEKTLIALIDDYDSYQLKFSDSKKIHYLFSTFTDDKLLTFYNTFKTGFTGFTDVQENSINNIISKIESVFTSLKIFKGTLKIGSNNMTVCSTFNNIFPSEICDSIIKKFDCDIVINVNLNTSSVSVRKKKGCGVNLGTFAKKIFDGGGDECVAGGKITKAFLELSKQLYPIT